MTAQPIYAGQDFYIPAFEMRLRGANVPRDVIRDVMQVSFKDSLTDVDSFDVPVRRSTNVIGSSTILAPARPASQAISTWNA